MARFRETVAEMMEDKPRRIGLTRRPLERIMSIHRAIKDGTYPNCSTLARQFEVTSKTIMRDIEFMRDSLGVEIEYDAVRHGWYASGTMPEIPGFTVGAEELAALFLTRTALDAIRGTALESTMRQVFSKIVASVEGTVHLEWSEMEEAFTRKMPAMHARDVKLFGELADAVLQRREIHFHYRKLDADKAAPRSVRPYHLGEVDGGWYLIGHDLDRGALRTFALPRITRFKMLMTVFERPLSFDGREHLRRSFGIWHQGGTRTHLVRVTLKDYAARLATERRWHPSQETTVLDEKGKLVEVRFEAAALEEVVRWVLSFGSKAEVIGPPELLQMVREELKLMRA
ncbi:helix-turn-helix transcriptional regulator [Luteolibacter sp. Populi]|uniref:helix-turn-helix transcriptional regulator n=1 Tax=Luteolibacter sp. Populi TaxID=3230487 RepID=UPI0034661967